MHHLYVQGSQLAVRLEPAAEHPNHHGCFRRLHRCDDPNCCRHELRLGGGPVSVSMRLLGYLFANPAEAATPGLRHLSSLVSGVFWLVLFALAWFVFVTSLWFLLGCLVDPDALLPYAVMVTSAAAVVRGLWQAGLPLLSALEMPRLPASLQRCVCCPEQELTHMRETLEEKLSLSQPSKSKPLRWLG